MILIEMIRTRSCGKIMFAKDVFYSIFPPFHDVSLKYKTLCNATDKKCCNKLCNDSTTRGKQADLFAVENIIINLL